MTAALLLLSTHPGAHAQTIHRCQSGNGTVAYQGHPCPAGMRASTRTYAPIRDDPAAAARLQQIESQAHAGRANKTDTAATRKRATRKPSRLQRPRQDARDRQRARCNAARSARDATLERVGLRRTFDVLRRLDDRVHAACKGL